MVRSAVLFVAWAGARHSRGHHERTAWRGERAHGLGVEVGLGRGVRVASERATLATDLINASVSGPDAENLSMVDRQKRAAELTKKAQEIGAATAMDPTKILEGPGAFVGKTGDLKTGVESIGDLARIARATGSNVADVASAAGDVSQPW